MKFSQFDRYCIWFIICTTFPNLVIAQTGVGWSWPQGKKAALSLTFDDARESQVVQGTPLFDEYGVKATFYVVPDQMKSKLEEWKTAVKNGHEIGNHTQNHPCTGNFDWKRDHALEDYTLASMQNELLATNKQIENMLGVVPTSYAYTCGQKFVGRGSNTRSYIPIVAEMFSSGRGFLDETANAPGFLDLAQLTGIESDGKDFGELQPYLDKARANGDWVVLAGHEIAESGNQTTRVSMLRELIDYAQDPANGIWLATVAEITDYIKNQQEQEPVQPLKESLTFHASFDHGYDADFAKGNPAIYTAPEYGKLEASEKGMECGDVSIVEGGRHGSALKFHKKSVPVLFYRSEDNVSYSQENWSGTISLWLQLDPEQDLEPGYCDPIQITDVGYNDAALWVDFTNKNPRQFRMGVFGDLAVWNPDNIGPDDNPDFNNRLVVAKERPFGRDTWTHVVISFAALGTENAQADFYVNGKLQGSQKEIPEPFTWDLLGSKIFIGLNYVGLLDEVAMFNRSLSEEEVGRLYRLEEGVKDLW